MTSDIDLWTGTYTDTNDEHWAAFTYEDDAVQFIHTDDHTQVWQGRTVVTESYGEGRIEAHYSHEADHILLVAATSHMGVPELEDTFDAADLAFDLATLDTDALEYVLQTLLAEWATHHGVGSPPYPDPAALDILAEYSNGDISDTRATPFEDRSIQEIFNVGVANIASQAHS